MSEAAVTNVNRNDVARVRDFVTPSLAHLTFVAILFCHAFLT